MKISDKTELRSKNSSPLERWGEAFFPSGRLESAYL